MFSFNYKMVVVESAVNGEGLEIYYQPIFNVAIGQFSSAEALARINDKTFGMISPLLFIPAAERLGMMQSLGAAIIEKVFRFISDNDLDRLGLSFIEINLSIAQCMQRNLPDTIMKLQKK